MHANLTLQMCWYSVDSLLIVSPLWFQGEAGSSGENGTPGAMVSDYRWDLKSMKKSSKWCNSSDLSSSICFFQGARGLPGERGRPGPPGPSVSVTSMHYCLHFLILHFYCTVNRALHLHLYWVCTQYETHFILSNILFSIQCNSTQYKSTLNSDSPWATIYKCQNENAPQV